MHHTIDGATIAIVPGDPEARQLLIRMERRGDAQMPPRGTEVVDGDGTAMIRAWIESLPTP